MNELNIEQISDEQLEMFLQNSINKYIQLRIQQIYLKIGKQLNRIINWRIPHNLRKVIVMPLDSQSQIIKNKRMQRPKTYFQLIERVGDDGKYQFNMFLIFSLVGFVGGIILMNTGFLFLQKDFECSQLGLLTGSCRDTICQLPPEERSNYTIKSDDDFKSLATEMGQFYCEDQIYLDLSKSSVYLGSFFGFILFSFFADNFGRRTSLLLSLSTCALGNLVVTLSPNLVVASLGLVLSGAGGNASINITFYFLGQTVENAKRQKYSVLVQTAFTVGAIIVTALYMVIPNWRVVSIILVAIPSFICLFLVLIYVEQTPQFLVKKTSAQALKALNRIGKINYQIKDIIEEEDILSVKEAQMATKQFNQITVTALDLVRYGSLRPITICSSIICFIMYAMYYGPVLIIDEIGFDVYVSSFIVQLSELVIFIPAYLYIQRMRRKLMGFAMFSVAVLAAGILIFVQKPEKCKICPQSIVELVIIFVFRAAIALYFCVFNLYVNQLYPSRISGLGMGIVSAVGALASTLNPIILGILNRSQTNIMIVFCVLGVIAMGLTSLLQQTKGKPIKAQVIEIQMLKQKQRKIVSSRGSFARYSLVKNNVKNDFEQKLL